MVSFGMALLLFSIRLLNWLDWEDLMGEIMERKGFFSLDYDPPPKESVKNRIAKLNV